LDVDHGLQIPFGELREPDDLVDAIDELRLENTRQVSPVVRGHDDDGVGEVDGPALAVGQASVV
jgi:hypothetical protein